MTDVVVAEPLATTRPSSPEPTVEVGPVDPTDPPRRPPTVHGIAALVLVVSLVIVVAAALAARAARQDTEQRLLERQTSQAGSVLGVAIANVTALLTQTAGAAEASGGDPVLFEQLASPSTGRQPGQPFVSMTLWDGRLDVLEPVSVVGEPPLLLERGEDAIRSMIADTMRVEALHVVGVHGPDDAARLGYGFSTPGTDDRFVVYVEGALPPQRRAVARNDEAFSGLDFAIYIGTEESEPGFVYSSVADLPIDGRRASTTVPFGDAELLLVMRPPEPLAGGILESLPLIVLTSGLALSLGFAALTQRLLRRRDVAVETSRALAIVSDENARLYAEQRGIAETLQRSLLPPLLATPPQTEIAARYWPAGEANEVGGDFYDLFALGPDRFGITIGDVCGKGVQAAALTGAARHTIRAAARHVDSPTEVLEWVHEAIAAKSTGMFCTVCFGVITIEDGRPSRIDLSLGGHPPLLLCHADGSCEEIGLVGTVLGMIEPKVRVSSHAIRPGDTLLLYTDGLTDAPGAAAVTVEELCQAHAAAPRRSPEDLAECIRELIEERRPLGSGDDTALLILRIAD